MKLKKMEDSDAILKDYDDSEIIVQQKIDGFKTQAIKDKGGSVKLYTRRGEGFEANVPPLVSVLEDKMSSGDFWLGELAYVKNGKQSISDVQTIVGSSPENAQAKLKESGGHMVFYVYDLLWDGGNDITKTPYIDRYNKLNKKVGKGELVEIVKNYSYSEKDEAINAALKAGGEGIVLKPKDSEYKYGPKGSSEPVGEWVKHKPKGKKSNTDEVILNKYTKKEKKLVFPMYQHKGDELFEVGQLSGMSKEDEAKLKKDIDAGKSVVVEISFQERMESGKFRHAGWSRFRPDKSAKEVKFSKASVRLLSKRAIEYFVIDKTIPISIRDIDSADDEDNKYEKEKDDPKWDKVLLDDGKSWTRREIRNHYQSNADKILKEIKGESVMIYIGTDKNKNILKRKHNDKPIVLNSKEDLMYWADRRLLSIHRVFGPKTNLGFVDLDVHGDFSQGTAKKYAKDIAGKIKSKYGSGSTIYDSGGTGYHIEFTLGEEKDVDTLRNELRELCEDLNEKYDGFTTGIVKGSGVRTDVTTLKNNGNIRVPYALHESKGGVKKPIGSKNAGPKPTLSKRAMEQKFQEGDIVEWADKKWKVIEYYLNEQREDWDVLLEQKDPPPGPNTIRRSAPELVLRPSVLEQSAMELEELANQRYKRQRSHGHEDYTWEEALDWANSQLKKDSNRRSQISKHASDLSIDTAKKIYELEYKLAMLNRRPVLSHRMEKLKSDIEYELGELLEGGFRSLLDVANAWLNHEVYGQAALELAKEGDDDAKKIYNNIIELKEELIRGPTGDISRDMVTFNRALQRAHQEGTMGAFLPFDPSLLDELSEGKFVPEYDIPSVHASCRTISKRAKDPLSTYKSNRVWPISKKSEKVWHITTEESAYNIMKSGFVPQETARGPGISISADPTVAAALFRTVKRMNSFKTREDVLNWYLGREADPGEIKRVAEWQKGTPARLYLSIMGAVHPAVGGNANIPYNEFLWADIGKNLADKNVVAVEAEYGRDTREFDPTEIEAEIFVQDESLLKPIDILIEPEQIKKASLISKRAKDPLSTYKSKRDFDDTSEPEGEKSGKNKYRFVIQRHKAKKAGEHFDLRLENDDGAMSSWAIPKHKLPSKGDKLLATKTEDHPIEYMKFKGEIPEGEYGAGTMTIHDSGTYEEIEKSANKLVFKLNGKKEKGTYTMVKTDGKKWLIMVASQDKKANLSKRATRPIPEIEEEIAEIKDLLDHIRYGMESGQVFGTGLLEDFEDDLKNVIQELEEAKKQPRDIEQYREYKEFVQKRENFTQNILRRAENELMILISEEYGYREWFWFPQMSASKVEFWWQTQERINDSTIWTDLPGEVIGDEYQELWGKLKRSGRYYNAHMHTDEDSFLQRPDGKAIIHKGRRMLE
jgi:DNA ligase D-like protein (predicted 3'-phosphoesterase)